MVVSVEVAGVGFVTAWLLNYRPVYSDRSYPSGYKEGALMAWGGFLFLPALNTWWRSRGQTRGLSCCSSIISIYRVGWNGCGCDVGRVYGYHDFSLVLLDRYLV